MIENKCECKCGNCSDEPNYSDSYCIHAPYQTLKGRGYCILTGIAPQRSWIHEQPDSTYALKWSEKTVETLNSQLDKSLEREAQLEHERDELENELFRSSSVFLGSLEKLEKERDEARGELERVREWARDEIKGWREAGSSGAEWNTPGEVGQHILILEERLEKVREVAKWLRKDRHPTIPGHKCERCQAFNDVADRLDRALNETTSEGKDPYINHPTENPVGSPKLLNETASEK